MTKDPSKPIRPDPPSMGDPRRSLPAIGTLLSQETFRDLEKRFGHDALVESLRSVLDEIRRGSFSAESVERQIEESTRRRLETEDRPTLRRVINATGILLHTNLGRAPFDRHALERIVPMLTGHVDLEWSVEEGVRAERGSATCRRLARLYGGEAALVVTNNAAAVLLALRALAGRGAEVLVSRGELVAIGGGFRIPEILGLAGCRLVEVGTTNKTTARDFERAITPKTKLLLRATPSNFVQRGFVESPSTDELAVLAHSRDIPFLVDQGSGAPRSLAPFGLSEIGTGTDSVSRGADLVAMSGDKLLGGPQAGIVVGRRRLIDQLRTDPFFRAVRPGRFTYALLGEIAASHLSDRAGIEIPLHRMLGQSTGELDRRAEEILRIVGPRRARIRVEPSEAALGGGTTPGEEIPSRAITIRSADESASTLAEKLRHQEPPVASRISDGRVWLDLRTVLPEDDPALARAIGAATEPEN